MARPPHHLEELFEKALALRPDQWASFLAEACGDDRALRDELMSLLIVSEDASRCFDDLQGVVSSLASEAWQSDEERLPGSRAEPRNLVGTRVSHYEVLEKLGGGGMGVVYRARDVRLNRQVALKFLPHHLSIDKHAKRRFSSEAVAASALDHPNICTIHEVGETETGEFFIVMACYSGETLKHKISNGPLPVSEALDYAAQIARGLANAHAAGIVHRDVKPANVMITEDGLVKILDFGLAKMVDVQVTQTGKTMGTVAYMSPEHIRGDKVDDRSDIWSLGVMLFEMLGGRRPFRGHHAQAVIYSILNERPEPLRNDDADATPALLRLVNRCLEKDPALRYTSVSDLLTALDQLGGPADTDARSPASPPAWIRWGGWIGGTVLALGLVVATVPALRNAVIQPFSESVGGRIRLVVLPFQTVGGDATDQAFVDGLSHMLTERLAEMGGVDSGLLVIPQDDIRDAKVVAPADAARSLKATIVVEGRMERRDESVRLDLRLVDARNNTVLKPLTLEGSADDLLRSQDSVVLWLANHLELELKPGIQQMLSPDRSAMPGANEFYAQGLGYLRQSEVGANIDVAIQLFNHAVTSDSLFAPAYAAMGDAYWRKYEATGERVWVDSALHAGTKAVSLDDALAPAHVTMGMIYDRTGQHELARTSFQRALEIDPDNATAYRQLARTYFKEGRMDLAEASYKKAIALNPGYWEFYNALGYLYNETGRHEEAAEQYLYVTKLRPDHPWGYNNLAVQHQKMGRLDEAISLYQKAIAINPKASSPTALAYLNLGGIYYGQNRFAEAIQMYEKALTIDSLDPDGWGNLANAYHWVGRVDDARETWLHTIDLALDRLEVDQDAVDAIEQVAVAYAKLGHRDQAFVYVGRLLALEGKPAATLEVVAKVYEILGERDLALRYIQKALQGGLQPSVINASAWLDSLRMDPRYSDALGSVARAL